MIPDVSLECNDLDRDLAHPQGEFTDIAVPEVYFCGLRTDGYVTCESRTRSFVVRPPVGPFNSITFGPSRVCGLDEDGSIECWGYGGIEDFEVPPGPFTAIDDGIGPILYSGRLCGLRPDGSVSCTRGPHARAEPSPPAGAFLAVRSGRGQDGPEFSCGIRRDQSVECWGPGDESLWKNISIPDGFYSDLSVGRYICGVRTDGSIACWGLPFGAGLPFDAGEIPEGPFSSVSVGASHACGLKTDGAVRCWGDDSRGQAYSPPGTFKAVAAGNLISCGLKTDGVAMCWGGTQGR